jgi:hypothetical protein
VAAHVSSVATCAASDPAQGACLCWSGASEPERRIELLTYALRVRCSAV